MQEVDVTFFQIDNKEYIIGKKLEYNGSNYVLLVNKDDYTDSLVQKESGDNLEPVENIELLHKILYLMKNSN